MRRVVILAWVAFALLLASCSSNDDSPIGFDWVGWDSPVYTVILYPDASWQDTYFDCYVNTGRSLRLLVGRFDHYLYRSLIMFRPQDLEFGSANDITCAKISFAMEREVGLLNDAVYNQGSLEIEVAPLYVDWLEDAASWYHADHYTPWDGGIFGPPQGIALAGEATEEITYVDIEITDMCRDWVADPNSNHGVIVMARDESQEVVKEFYSLDILTREGVPKLIIEYQEDGEKKKVSIPPAIDCFITTSDERFFDDDVPGYNEEIMVGGFNGYSYRAMMYFDLSQEITFIPRDATIVLAELKLYYKPGSKADESLIRAYVLDQPFDESMNRGTLASLQFNTSTSYGEMDIEGAPEGFLGIFINQMVQGWISGSLNNYGLLLMADGEYLDSTCHIEFSSTDNSNPSYWPYLLVKFTLPPGYPPDWMMANDSL